MILKGLVRARRWRRSIATAAAVPSGTSGSSGAHAPPTSTVVKGTGVAQTLKHSVPGAPNWRISAFEDGWRETDIS